MNDNKTKALIGKIRALMQKTTENGCSEAEMQSAMKMAQKIMQEHNIDLNQVEYDSISEAEIDGFKRSAYKWYVVLANYFNCTALKRRMGRYSVYYFVGSEGNTMLANYFYKYILQLKEIAYNEFKQTEKFAELKKIYHGRTISSDFEKGFFIGVSRKIRQLEEEKGDTKELAMVNKYLSNKNIKNKKPTRITYKSDALGEGKTEGGKINLRTPLQNKQTNTKLLN